MTENTTGDGTVLWYLAFAIGVVILALAGYVGYVLYMNRTAPPTTPNLNPLPSRNHCHTSQPPPISARPASANNMSERMSSMLLSPFRAVCMWS